MKLTFVLIICIFGVVLSASVQKDVKSKNSKPSDSQKKDDVEPFAKEIDMRKERAKPSAQSAQNAQNAPLKTEMKELLDGEPLPQSKLMQFIIWFVQTHAFLCTILL